MKTDSNVIRIKPRNQEWAKVLGEDNRSGLTPTEFCRQHSLNTSTFYKYKNLLSCSQKEEPFLELPIDSKTLRKVSVIFNEFKVECEIRDLRSVVSALKQV